MTVSTTSSGPAARRSDGGGGAFSLRRLMAERGVADPHDHAAEHDLEYQVFDEARACFEALGIPAELIATVAELSLDGGRRSTWGAPPCGTARTTSST